MFIRKTVEQVLLLGDSLRTRRIGKTHTLSKLAKKVGGILVCGNAEIAKSHSEMYGCETISIQRLDSLSGSDQPIIFDPDSLLFLLDQLDYALVRKDIEYTDLKNTVEDVKKILDTL